MVHTSIDTPFHSSNLKSHLANPDDATTETPLVSWFRGKSRIDCQRSLASFDPIQHRATTRFESQVKATVSENDVRLQYLEQYLQREPKELIKECLHLDRNSSYLEAKELLEEKYRDPYKISNVTFHKYRSRNCHRSSLFGRSPPSFGWLIG